MSLTSAMLVGFSGIKSNSVAVDTVGNNLANLNTTAFKGQRTLFETLMYETISEGEAPRGISGGTLPYQIGLGSKVGSLQRSFAQGGLDTTGFPSDLAIDGQGFFLVEQGDGTLAYTRDGSFRLDATQTMVGAGGTPLQVFAADAAGNIDTANLTNLVIPLGSISDAVSTTAVQMDGRLDSNTNVASAGAVVTSQPLATLGGAATTTTALADLVDANGVPLFVSGDVVDVNGLRGEIATETSSFVVGTTGTTLGDLATFMEQAYGINTDTATGGTPGVTISDGTDVPAGSIVVQSNVGEINAISLNGGSVVNKTGAVTSPFSFATTSEAIGGGVTTTFGVFDSLGNQVDVRLRAVLESKSDTGTVWRFFAESINDSDISPNLGTGTITFDTSGQFVASTGTDVTIDLAGSGAAAPLSFSLDLTELRGVGGTDGNSELIMASQDGAPAGVLNGFSIDAEGIVRGAFSNQQTVVFGQVAVATFRNQEGLVDIGGNRFVEGPNSGAASIIEPRTGSAGAVRAGALEQSNVEIAREFVNLITASTGISSASRVVRVADDLLQELLLLAR